MSCDAAEEHFTPAEGGDLCALCDKVVVDTSTMTLEEFQALFDERGAQMCVRMNVDAERVGVFLSEPEAKLTRQRDGLIRLLAASVAVPALLLAACEPPAQPAVDVPAALADAPAAEEAVEPELTVIELNEPAAPGPITFESRIDADKEEAVVRIPRRASCHERDDIDCLDLSEVQHRDSLRARLDDIEALQRKRDERMARKRKMLLERHRMMVGVPIE